MNILSVIAKKYSDLGLRLKLVLAFAAVILVISAFIYMFLPVGDKIASMSVFLMGLYIIYVVCIIITRPIDKMLKTVKNITAGNLSDRVHNESKDEIGQLARAFNEMVGKLEDMVSDRTLELNRTVEMLQKEINERRKAEYQVKSSEAMYKKLASESERAKEIALNAARMKTEFVANMSHEIRTPLNGVVAMTRLLMETELNEEQKELASVIQTSGNSLLNIVNDILDFSKIEAGKFSLEIEKFEISHLIDETVSVFVPKARSKNLRLIHEIDPRIYPLLEGDPHRLKQIISIILGNAVKFTGSGYVSLRVQIETETERHQILSFEVKDSGIGISEEHLHNLFEPFTPGDVSTSKRYGGTGLGLSIAKSLIELMNGHISVQSTLNQGSTFTFTAEFAKSITKTELKTAKASGQPSLMIDNMINDRKILLVEDHPINRHVAAKMLNNFGIRHITAAVNGIEAVDTFITEDFDLILMDCQMPEMDGYAATRKIRELSAGKSHIPIIAMTASVLSGDRERCIMAGMDDYLPKPIEPVELCRILNKYLNSYQTGIYSSSFRKTPVFSRFSPDMFNNKIDTSRLNMLAEYCSADEDPVEVVMQFMTTYLDYFPEEFAKLKAAVYCRDFTLIRETAHGLKGSNANIGATALQKLFLEVEIKARNNSIDGIEKLLKEAEEYFSELSEQIMRFIKSESR